jgi:hypothetical protein
LYLIWIEEERKELKMESELVCVEGREGEEEEKREEGRKGGGEGRGERGEGRGRERGSKPQNPQSHDHCLVIIDWLVFRFTAFILPFNKIILSRFFIQQANSIFLI